jgi:maleylacetoacetate isomerase
MLSPPPSIDESTLHLYTYFRSTSSARVRIAAHLKSIPLTYTYISIPNGEHLCPPYAAINPNLTVPTLSFKLKSPDPDPQPIYIHQSTAILELLEELYPHRKPLLPPPTDPIARAHVRSLVALTTSDIQPPTNQRILKCLRTQQVDSDAWAEDLMEKGLAAFEAMAAQGAGKFCFGDSVTLADVVLAPAVVNARRYGVEVERFPTVARVEGVLEGMEAFRRGGWREQGDTPVELRWDGGGGGSFD